jgi:outer membrane protein assembly factor BamB
VVCLDLKSGRILWDRSVEPVLPEDPYMGQFTQHGYASHTPTSDGTRIYVFFGKTGVLAFDLEGKKLWQTGVGIGSGAHGWGTASSPILYKDLVIVPAAAESQSLVALNRESGKEGTDLVLAVPHKIWGFNPDTGKRRWSCDGLDSDSICSSPIARDGIVYVLETGHARALAG